MKTDFQKNILDKVIAGIIVVLKWIGSAVLAMMMFLTAVDVACRYIFNSPIIGARELVEYMMAILIPFSVAYCAFCKSHVAVEFILDQFPKKIQKTVIFPINILSLLFIVLIAWQSYLYTVETFESKLTSAVLLIVTYPFVIPIAVGMGVFALILLNDMLPDAVKKEER